MTVKVIITPKPDILDPQGKAVGHALHDLGYEEVTDVRVGKYMVLELTATPGENPVERVEEMCRRLLANINIESFSIETSES